MKNVLILSLLIIASASCRHQSARYRISGHIEGLDSGKVYLVKAEKGQPLVLDTAAVAKGGFLFEGESPETEMHFLRLNEQNYFAQFFLDPARIKVEAWRDSLQATKVTGSPATDIFMSYVKEFRLMMEKMKEYQNEYYKAETSGNKQEADRVRADVEATAENMKFYAKNFVRENRTSAVAPFIVLSQLAEQLNYKELKELVDTLVPELSESVYVKELNSILEAKSVTAEGVVAPDFTMNGPDGKPVTLSSFRGKYLLVDFWAAWCAPCREENPNVVEAYNRYKDKGFDILGVSLDRNKEDWMKAIADDKLVWHHVSDLKYFQNEAARLYRVEAIPYSVLLDKEGKIIAKNLRGEKLLVKLAELMP